jgi:hypothetical protein
VRTDQAPVPKGLAPYLDRVRAGGWRAVGVFLAIALVTLLVLIFLLKKTNPAHLSVGAGMVMLIYLAVGGFLVLASRVFVSRHDGR